MIDNDYREVDTDEKNVSDVEETKEGTPVETGEIVTDDPTEDNEKTDDFDEFCAMCRRPASKAGKLIHVHILTVPEQSQDSAPVQLPFY